jgi:hypothetical protein
MFHPHFSTSMQLSMLSDTHAIKYILVLINAMKSVKKAVFVPQK